MRQDENRNEWREPARSTQREAWPWKAQFSIVLSVLLFATALVLLPVLVVSRASQGTANLSDLWGSLLATFVALTGATISGIFVFAVFRIDRQVEYTTREIVYEMLRELMTQTIADQIRKAKASLQKEMNEVREEVNKAKTQVGKYVQNVQRVEENIRGIDTKVAESKAKIAEALDGIEPKMDSEFADLKTFVKKMAIEELKEKIREQDDRDRGNGGGEDSA